MFSYMQTSSERTIADVTNCQQNYYYYYHDHNNPYWYPVHTLQNYSSFNNSIVPYSPTNNNFSNYVPHYSRYSQYHQCNSYSYGHIDGCFSLSRDNRYSGSCTGKCICLDLIIIQIHISSVNLATELKIFAIFVAHPFAWPNFLNFIRK